MSGQRFCRVEHGGNHAFGRIDEGEIALLDSAPWLAGKETGESIPRADARLVVPVEPTKILCVGRNYRAHAKELGNEVPVEPMLFFKPPSSLLASGGDIQLPPRQISERIEHEAELGVIIGRRLKHATREQAIDGVFGYTAVCDVTARDLQKKDGQWWRAKGMDTFCVVGPEVVTGIDPRALDLTCTVSGALRQQGNTRDMIFDVPTVIQFVSQVMTLEPGDLIATGTPEGVGPLVGGDLLEIRIGQIAPLFAKVAAFPS